MTTYKINITNQKQQKIYIRNFFFVMLPLFILVFLNQKYSFIKNEGNILLIGTIVVFTLPSLVVGYKLKLNQSDEDIAVNHDMITTKFFGIIKFADISKVHFSKEEDVKIEYLKLKLNDGKEIVFSPLSRQFNNKKHQDVFNDFLRGFKTQFEKSNTLSSTITNSHKNQANSKVSIKTIQN